MISAGGGDRFRFHTWGEMQTGQHWVQAGGQSFERMQMHIHATFTAGLDVPSHLPVVWCKSQLRQVVMAPLDHNCVHDHLHKVTPTVRTPQAYAVPLVPHGDAHRRRLGHGRLFVVGDD